LPAEAALLTRRYRAYLFDLDGTLVDSAPDINGALNAALAAGGYPAVTERQTRQWIGSGSPALIEHALTHHRATRHLTDPAHIQQLLDAFIAHYGAHIADASQVYPGVVGALTELSARGASLAVVTNKLSQLSIQLLEALDLHRYFGVIVGGDTLPERKPDPEPARHACKALGCSPGDALFVGDSITDVQTARAAGCAIVCLRDGYNHGVAPDALGADAIIDSLTALL